MIKSNMQILAEFGQSVWLDSISCSMIESGKLQSMIDQGLRGLTSNPSIFNQAISSSADYDTHISQLKEQGKSIFEIYDDLTVADIQAAADAFLPVYHGTNKVDGYVSLEINPQLANQSDDSIQEGFRLFNKVNRPNLMIKVPATPQGFPVIEALIAEGINVNATLIFSLEQYFQTTQAYIRGLEKLSQKREDLSSVHSVASVFVSRIDTAVDKKIEELIAQEENALKKKNLFSLEGKAAVSNCLLVYKKYQEVFSSEIFQSLQAKNGNIQRVLWASTSTKNPAYNDVKYVSELIIEDTVNTIPEKTLHAFLDHGEVKKGFGSQEIHDAGRYIESLSSYGIDIKDTCHLLLEDGVSAFSKAFEDLFVSIEQKSKILSAQL